jgi:hypothetical protein
MRPSKEVQCATEPPDALVGLYTDPAYAAWAEGTLTVEYEYAPEPGTLALLGFVSTEGRVHR